MARTRNTVSKAAHLLRSGAQVDVSGSNAITAGGSNIRSSSSQGKKSDKPANLTKQDAGSSDSDESRQLDGIADDEASEDDSSDEESNDQESDVVESEEDDSENYYPTKVAKKREIGTVDPGKKVSRDFRGLQKADSKVTNKAPQPSSHSKASTASLPTGSKPAKFPCIACRNAHHKCTPAMPGQPCERCARLRLRCVVDPNHKRVRAGDRTSQGNIARGKETAAAHELPEEDSSDDPLNSPVPLKLSAPRKIIAKPSGHATSSFPKHPIEDQHCSSSSSPLSSAPDTSDDDDDELDITMAGTNMANKKRQQGVLVSAPKPSSKRRPTRAAARKGPTHGISPMTSNGQQQIHSSSPVARQSQPMDNPVPEQNKLPTDPLLSDGTTTKAQMGKGTQNKQVSYDASPVDRTGTPGLASQFHDAPPTTSPAQHSERPTSTVPEEIMSMSTCPRGQSSVLNPDLNDNEPLPPISQLGRGGAYIGRYDAHLASELTTVCTNTHIPTIQAPPTPTGCDLSRGPHDDPAMHQIPTATTTTSHDDMPAEGTPAYRYSATKILLLLKHGQRAQLLALGGAHIAPDTVGQLNIEVEGARQRAIALWHEVHDHVPAGAHMYDMGGLAFLEGMGR